MPQDKGYCRYCKQEILWAITDGNLRPMPLDPMAHVDGNVAVYRNENWIPMCYVITPVNTLGKVPGAQPHKSHFETCPKLPKRKPQEGVIVLSADPEQDELDLYGDNVIPIKRRRR